MKIKKVSITFTAYGKDEADAFENLLFDINEVTKDPDMDDFNYEDTTTEEEELDAEQFED